MHDFGVNKSHQREHMSITERQKGKAGGRQAGSSRFH
jgi:hypothetical protein